MCMQVVTRDSRARGKVTNYAIQFTARRSSRKSRGMVGFQVSGSTYSFWKGTYEIAQ